MIFHDTSLADAKLIDIEPRGDERGLFARTMCLDEFADHGIRAEFVQQNMSVTAHAGTLRGMHFQLAPHSEGKLIRCVRGAIFDVIVDLRARSPSFMQHESFELSEANLRMLWVPEGFAHGFLTLTDACEMTYLFTTRYVAAAQTGLRYDDPALAIDWPQRPGVLSEKDAAWPLLETDRPAFF